MNYSADIVLAYKNGEDININKINDVCERHPNSKILIELENTKGLSSSTIKNIKSNNIAIRIAGSYDKDRVARRKDYKFTNGETGEYYITAVTYTKRETIKILEAIEDIEKEISPEWSDIQKVVYLYDKLKSTIMYDPKFKKKYSNEIRSLRGLITKETVCAGYSVMFKELLDRQGIYCEYVEGKIPTKSTDNGHAWNIIGLHGKKYPIDLTWDNTNFRNGKQTEHQWLAADLKEFCRTHKPMDDEKTQNYEQTLSVLSPDLIRLLSNRNRREVEFSNTVFTGDRDDNSKYIIAQIGDALIEDKWMHRYYYADYINGEYKNPVILYTEGNVSTLIQAKRFGLPIPDGYEEGLDVLFSKENIQDSINKGSYYIGDIRRNNDENKLNCVRNTSEVRKPKEKLDKFKFSTRTYTRRDGTEIIVQKSKETTFNAMGTGVFKYDVIEMINNNGRSTLKKNIIMTDNDIFMINDQLIANIFLTRDRLDERYKEAGGYLGSIDNNGNITYKDNLSEFFKISSKIDTDRLDKKVVPLPTFAKLKQLALDYDIELDLTKDTFDMADYVVIDKKTKKIITDQPLRNQILFANMWLTAAGVKIYGDEEKRGMNYAFNSAAEELYNILCNELQEQVKNNNVIDTIEAFKKISSNVNYKYKNEIMIKLFRTPDQVKIVNNLTHLSLGKYGLEKEQPIPLYSESRVGQLLANNVPDTDPGMHL